MSATDFPSGPWTGYYQYPSGGRGHQDLLLQFEGGRMSGMGHDELGQFEISGTYDEVSKEAQWLKLYPDGHQVDYRGFREGPVPGIWGVWEIPHNWSGGFHIWPLLSLSEDEVEEQASLPQRQTWQDPVALPA